MNGKKVLWSNITVRPEKKKKKNNRAPTCMLVRINMLKESNIQFKNKQKTHAILA